MKDLTFFEPKYKTLIGYLTGIEKAQSINDVLIQVIERTKITPDQIASKSHEWNYSEPRFFYCYKAKKEFPQVSNKAIGKLVNRDHSSVTHAIKQISNVPTLRAKYIELFGEI